jgi:hypothetical protein
MLGRPVNGKAAVCSVTVSIRFDAQIPYFNGIPAGAEADRALSRGRHPVSALAADGARITRFVIPEHKQNLGEDYPTKFIPSEFARLGATEGRR